MRRSVAIVISALVAACCGTTMAQAVQYSQRDPIFPERAYTCRLDGADVPLGEHRCLRTPQGTRTAECAIVLNMSSWKSLAESCP